jgi:hypothetical protein
MSSPSDTQPPVEPVDPEQSATQEVPFLPQATATQQRPPHPDAVPHAPGAMDAPQPTGPINFVPGLPGAGTPSVPPAASAPPPPPMQPVDAPPTASWPHTLEADAPTERPEKQRRIRVPRDGTDSARTPRDRAALIALGLAVLSLGLLEVGLALDFGLEPYWSVVTLWSAFATVCAVLAVLALAASLPAGSRVRSGTVWRIAAGGLVGLAVFWLLVVLPVVASDRGFLLTAALGALGAAVWIGPGRKA